MLPWLSVWGVERVQEGCGDVRTRGSAGLGVAMGPAVIPLSARESGGSASLGVVEVCYFLHRSWERRDNPGPSCSGELRQGLSAVSV